MKKLIIIGAGGYGRTVFDIAAQSEKYDEIKFLDDNSELAIGKCNDWEKFISDYEIYPAFGNNELRLKLINEIINQGGEIPTIIHKSAYISPKSSVDIGTVVLPKAIINTNVKIKKGCIINCGAVIDHDCIIEEGSHICLGAIIKGENKIPKYSKIEAGEVVENRKFPI